MTIKSYANTVVSLIFVTVCVPQTRGSTLEGIEQRLYG